VTPELTPEAIGRKIRAARERRGWTQRQCSIRLPVAQSTWCDWERGKMAPRMDKLPGIARLLGVAVARLLA
jgi:transcriptional regulator with XRE-family HTH domain